MNIWNAILKRLEKYCDEQNILVEKLFIDLRENRKIKNFYERARRNDLEPNDYNDKNIQLAYILRYFNLYCFQIYFCLIELSNFREEDGCLDLFLADFTQKESAHNLALFGSGPCPEIIGLHQYIKEQNESKVTLNCYSFDIKNTEWHFARKIFLGSYEKEITSIDFDFTTNFNDLSEDYSNFFSLISFQNCLIEMGENEKKSFVSQIGRIIELLNESGCIIISDRRGAQIDTLFDMILDELTGAGPRDISIADAGKYNCIEYECNYSGKIYDLAFLEGAEYSRAEEPPPQFKNFFTDDSGFFATKKNDFRYLTIFKKDVQKKQLMKDVKYDKNDDYQEYRKALSESQDRYNAYEPWTEKEDLELERLSQRLGVDELADHFKRRKGGIRSRLKKLNLL